MSASFFEPYFAITVGGYTFVKDDLVRTTNVKVKFQAKKDDQASFTVLETNGFKYQGLCQQGMDATIEIGHLRGERETFQGLVSGARANFSEKGTATITVECGSKALKGHSDQKSREFKEKKRSDIASEIAATHGWEADVIPTPDKIRQETQAGETDVQFLERLAEKEDYYFKITDNKMVFKPWELANSSSGSFQYRSGNFMVRSFKPKYEGQDKGKKSKASNVDEKEKEEITAGEDPGGSATAASKMGIETATDHTSEVRSGDSSQWASRGSGNPKSPVARTPAEPVGSSVPAPIRLTGAGEIIGNVLLDRAEFYMDRAQQIREAGDHPGNVSAAANRESRGKALKKIAHWFKDNEEGGALPDKQGEMNKAASKKDRKNQKIVGAVVGLNACFPKIRGNQKVNVTGVGPLYSGDYYVEIAEHAASPRGALTKLTLSKNALGGGKSGGKGGSGGGGAGLAANLGGLGQAVVAAITESGANTRVMPEGVQASKGNHNAAIYTATQLHMGGRGL